VPLERLEIEDKDEDEEQFALFFQTKT
jgi:hypothetical protein